MATRHRRKRRRNAGSFGPGPDPRRHVFTRVECQRGYQAAMEGVGKCNDPTVSAWVWRKVRAYYNEHFPAPT
jgi:hypothetical protein